MLAPEYVRSPIGVAKFIVLIASAGALILSGSTRPTELQKEIVDSTWKEDGLFYLSIVGIVMTLLSVALGIIFNVQCSRRELRIKEVCIFGLACVAFIIFGSGTLESALSIFSRVGDCCEEWHEEANSTCTLPGFLMESYYSYLKVPPTEAKIVHGGGDFFLNFPDFPECDNELDFNSWRCTVCVNELIQPLFKIKGAAGAAGLIAALAYFIVAFVVIREMRARKPTVTTFIRCHSDRK